MGKIAQYHLHKAHPEKLQFQVYDLNTYRKKNRDKAAEPHSHSYYQVIWFFEEGGTHTVDFKSFAIQKNTVLFISKDQIHSFDENLAVNGWLMHFNESFFMHSDVDIFLKYNIFNAQENPCYTIDGDTVEIGTSYISLIRQELDNRNSFGSEEVIRFLLKSFLIILERIHRTSVEGSIALTNQHELQFFRFKELVEEHYANHTAVTFYANALHISSKTLATITKNMVQKSPSQLITERIILESRRLLRFTSLQVGEIAFRLGFEDVSYFVKYFKRNLGCSPLGFRNETS